ncbi:M12 family metallopeptidase [Tunturiibacter empetritectus]|uniref:Peptidase metallopeptidase domain-containing protein n=2 Tax=Tunturiibacter TaxID=3154218 RepID=A0A852VAK0_9BACT|nr:matrixin family metalloprotease [Edaphobacter lichenicola]NYF89923.1 hypothetical protein [Edaphobacter lichenicola]
MMRPWLLVVGLASLVSAGLQNESKSPSPNLKIHVCSAKDPPRVRKALNKLAQSPMFNQELNITSLSASQLADIRAISPSIQQGVMKPELWPQGSTIKVAFLSGDPTVRERIKQSAMKWTDYVNVKFNFVDDPTQASIRIGVDGNGRSESEIGNDALQIDGTKETMHFGWLTTFSSQADYDSVVLHEFGHALGLVHEHQLPNTGIIWNKPYVYQYCKTQWGWTTDDVDQNIFNQYTPKQLIFTRMDTSSIMIYSFPSEWTQNNISAPWTYQLSDGDKQFMALQYPKAPMPSVSGHP